MIELTELESLRSGTLAFYETTRRNYAASAWFGEKGSSQAYDGESEKSALTWGQPAVIHETCRAGFEEHSDEIARGFCSRLGLRGYPGGRSSGSYGSGLGGVLGAICKQLFSPNA